MPVEAASTLDTPKIPTTLHYAISQTTAKFTLAAVRNCGLKNLSVTQFLSTLA
jgi:hypothetical protein